MRGRRGRLAMAVKILAMALLAVLLLPGYAYASEPGCNPPSDPPGTGGTLPQMEIHAEKGLGSEAPKSGGGLAVEGAVEPENEAIDRSTNPDSEVAPLSSTPLAQELAPEAIPSISVSINPPAPDGAGGWYRSQPVITLHGEAQPGSFLDRWQYSWDGNIWQTSYVEGEKTRDDVILAPRDHGAYTLFYGLYERSGSFGSGTITLRWAEMIQAGPIAYPNSIEPPSEYTTSLFGTEIFQPSLRNYSGYIIPADFGPFTAEIAQVDFFVRDHGHMATYSLGSSTAPGPDGLFRGPSFNPCSYFSQDGVYEYGVAYTDIYANSFEASRSFLLDTALPVLENQEITDIGYHNITIDRIVADGTYPLLPAQIGSPFAVEAVWLQWGKSTSYGSQVEVTSYWDTGEGIQVFNPVPINGLDPGTVYHYRFRMIDMSHNVGFSQDFTVTTLAFPSMTVTASAKVEGPTSATVAASVNMAASCNVNFGRDASSLDGTVGPAVSDANNNVSLRLDGLQPGTVYYYRVTAASSQFQGLQAESQTLSFETPPVAMPPEPEPQPAPQPTPAPEALSSGGGQQLPQTGSDLCMWMNLGGLAVFLGLLILLLEGISRRLSHPRVWK